MSYVRFDDAHESGRLSQFRERLSGEVRMQLGEEFPIFQDRNDILWGQKWKQRIEESIDASTFLIPILTPGFFNSPACRAELERFLKREEQLGRGDLILPVYYVNAPALNDEARREADPLAKVLAGRQYADWRELRFEPFTSPQVGRTLAKMAEQVVAALERDRPMRPSAALPPTARSGLAAIPENIAAITQSLEAVRGPTAKTEPPTIIVDAMHRGDYLTLTEALAAAKPGDRILVRPGLYREGIVIDKPVEIIGQGKLGEVVIEATGQDAMMFQASMGRVANLTLRHLGAGASCVNIAQGRLDLEDCDIASRSSVCVVIRGGADPRLRRNRIYDGGSGVVVFSNGKGTLEDNDIFGTAGHGVLVIAGGNPTLRRNRIHNCQKSGVAIGGTGGGVLEDNDVFGNLEGGVAIMGLGNPILRRNRVTKNGHSAIRITADGRGIFEDNDLRDNVRGAWDISPDSKDKVTRRGNIE